MKILYITLIILAGLLFIGWLGLQVKPAMFPPYEAQTADFKTIPLPENLPAPVERFYRAVYGENIPVIEFGCLSRPGDRPSHYEYPTAGALYLCAQRREGLPSLHRGDVVRLPDHEGE